MSTDLYKTFTLKPHRITDPKNNQLVKHQVMRQIAQDATILSELTEYQITCDPNLLKDLETVNGVSANVAGRRLGLTYPDNPAESWKAGKSRFYMMANAQTIELARSWDARTKAYLGTSDKHINQGWKRTADPTRPTTSPLINLATADNQYTRLRHEGNQLILEMVVSGSWVRIYFNYDHNRFKDAYKITKPRIVLDDDGNPEFIFSAVYKYNYTAISSRYIIGIDVGITRYATVAVYDTETNQVKYYHLGERVNSLHNSAIASAKQARRLHELGRHDEAVSHREAASRKKREAAILAGQEIAALSFEHDNAIVTVEYLGWIVNTMACGRWNRGELVRWIEHYVELNGGRVFSVSAYKTSQLCHVCDVALEPLSYRDLVCSGCGVVHDRDENAAANVAKRWVDRLPGTVATRESAKQYTTDRVRRSPVVRRSRGRDRTKNVPTPRREVSKVSVSVAPVPVRAVSGIATVGTDAGTTMIAGTLERRANSTLLVNGVFYDPLLE